MHGPLRVAVPFVVDEVDEAARQWTWSVFAGPVRLQLRHWVSPGPDGGATTGLRVRGAAPLVAGYAPLALIALQGLVRARAELARPGPRAVVAPRTVRP